jgi:hypothetical protein
MEWRGREMVSSQKIVNDSRKSERGKEKNKIGKRKEKRKETTKREGKLPQNRTSLS